MIKRIGFFVYGIACYAMLIGTFLYAVGWVGNLFVPTRLDGARTGGLGTALLQYLETLGDHPQIWISTNIENVGMQRTLQKLDYKLSGVVNNLATLPELVYVKSLR